MAENNLIPYLESLHLEENKDFVISEEVAHEIIEMRGKVLMVFERMDGSLYGYLATQVTDLGHAKKVTVNEFIRFETYN